MSEENRPNRWENLAAELGAEVRPEHEAPAAQRPPETARPPQRQRPSSPPKPPRRASWDEVASELGLPPAPGEAVASGGGPGKARIETRVPPDEATAGTRPAQVERASFERESPPVQTDADTSRESAEGFRPRRHDARPRDKREKADQDTRLDRTRESGSGHRAAAERGSEDQPIGEGERRGGKRRRRRGGRSRSRDRDRSADEPRSPVGGGDELTARETDDSFDSEIDRDFPAGDADSDFADRGFLDETDDERGRMPGDDEGIRRQQRRESGAEEPTERKRRRRRRGRGRGTRDEAARNKVDRSETAEDDSDELAGDEPSSSPESTDRQIDRANLRRESDDEPEDGHDDEQERHSHRSIPSWQETVGVMIEANLANRARSPHGSSAQQRRGGRSRRGGGRGRSNSDR